MFLNRDICNKHCENKMDKNQLVQLLDKHVKELESISLPLYGIKYDYAKANELLQKTRMFSNKYFQLQFYNSELIGIKFEPIYISKFTSIEDYKKAWDFGMIELISIAKAMLEDARLSSIAPPPIRIIEDNSKVVELSERVKKAEIKNKEIESQYKEILAQQKIEKDKLKIKFTKIKKWGVFLVLLIVLSSLLWSFNYFVSWNWLSGHPKKLALLISFQLIIIFSLLRIITNNVAIKVLDIVTGIVLVILSIL
jgi:hypothetical protein